MRRIVCESCRKPFEATRRDARYCSGRCRVAALRARRVAAGVTPERQESLRDLGRMLDALDRKYAPTRSLIFTCDCGCSFAPRRRDQRFCSDRCRVAAHRARRKVA